MKKTLLALCTFSLGLASHAQVLVTENASALTVGNIGTDLTGVTPGQGDWLTLVNATGSASDFQVIDQGGDYGNLVQITGPSTAVAADTRRMFKDVSGDWGFRDSGNNVAEVQFDFFSGPPTTSNNSQRIVLSVPGTPTKILGGMMFSHGTKVLSGLAYYDNAGNVANYLFRLSYTATPTPAYSDLVLQPNTWYRVGFSFNYTTGEVIFKESTGLITSSPIIGASAGLDAVRLEMQMTAITLTTDTNNTSAIGLFDNLNFQASAVNSPLAVSTFASENQFAVYPNPATNIINIAHDDAKITSVTVTDLNGRIVKQASYDQVSKVEMNIAELSSGAYMMNIKSSQGESNKKIMKQ